MTLVLKDPDSALDYAVDWGAEYLSGDSLVESSWEIVPAEAGGLSVATSSFDDRVATVTASGGIAGHLYQLANSVVLASGLVDRRSIVIRVEKR